MKTKNLNKKGFTLIELLAVIVILAIILVITVPNVLDTVNNSKKGVARDQAILIYKAAETCITNEQALGNGIPVNNCNSLTALDNRNYYKKNTGEDAIITINNDGTVTGIKYIEKTKTATKVMCAYSDPNGEGKSGVKGGMTDGTSIPSADSINSENCK